MQFKKIDGTNLYWGVKDDDLLINLIDKELTNYEGNSIPDNYHPWSKTITSVRIVKGVTEIGERAFADYSQISYVIFPETIKVIADSAFSNCESIKYINIPQGIENIERYAFYHTGIENLYIPGNVKEIGYRSFSDCYKLRGATLNDGVKFIGEGAFCGCNSIKAFRLPSGITLGDYAFAYCNNLSSIYLEKYTEEFGIESKQLFGTEYLDRDLTIYVPENDLEIYQEIFDNQKSNVKSIVYVSDK